jgi:hypothetical protein
VPEDYMPPYPKGLKMDETDEELIRALFEKDYQARKQKDKNRKKSDQQKRNQQRKQLSRQVSQQQ